MGEIILKVHDSYRMVVAVCDKELLGKVFVDGKKQLDLSGNFFKGEEISKDDLKDKIEWCSGEDATFNVIGKNSIEVFKEVGLVVDEGVLEICGIPFALVLL